MSDAHIVKYDIIVRPYCIDGGVMRAVVTVVVAAAALSAPTYAQVYKCTVNGSTVFSDKPCEAGAKPIDVRPATGAYDPAAGAEVRARMESADLQLRQRTIRNDIQRLEAKLSSTRRQRDRELATLRGQKQRAMNNLAGATYMGSLSTEMQAVTARYDTDIRLIESEIEKLRKELAELN